jgi:PAS domain-containing protein
MMERILGTCVPGKALVGRDNHFLYTNDYFNEAIGYSKEEIESITLSTVVPDHGHEGKVFKWFECPKTLLLRKVQVIHKTDGLINVAVGIVPQKDVAAVGLVKL